MWIAKLQIKHDCIIGKRCEKFNCSSLGYPLDFFEEKGYHYYFHFEKLNGDKKDIERYIKDLKKDKQVQNLEAENNMIFFTYRTKSKKSMPTQSYLKRVFHLKPVFVDTKGIEHLEIGSWKKEAIMDFIATIKKFTEGIELFEIQKIVQTKMKDVHFPHVMPFLTPQQEKALELAKKQGYYDFPRKIELRELAKMMKVSLSTYREHLRKAEKIILKGV